MANQIEVTVYQIDGSPLPSPINLSFLTSDIMIKEAALPIAAVNSAIFYYPNPSNKLGNQVFYVSETLANLLLAANSGGTTQVQATVIKIDQDPQVPAGVTYTFPANNIAIWENIDAVAGTNADIQYKNKIYSVTQTEADLVTAANTVPPVSGFGKYGSFFSTQDFTGGSIQALTFNNTDFADGVSIANNSEITFNTLGKYNIQFSAQLYKTGGTGATIYIWLRHNGVDVPNSATALEMGNNNIYLVAAWNFFVNVNTNPQQFQLMWYTSNATVSIETLSDAQTPAGVPAVPSILLTVNQVG